MTALTIGVSSRALFDLSAEDAVFKEHGMQGFRNYQKEHENDLPKPGTALPLVKALTRVNEGMNPKPVQIVIMSRNHPDVSPRVLKAIHEYKLDIGPKLFSGNEPLAGYFQAYDIDLFLSADPVDVQGALKSGIAGGLVQSPPEGSELDLSELRIAFDYDSVIVSSAYDRIWADKGPQEYFESEQRNAHLPHEDGPFAPFLRKLSNLQQVVGQRLPIRIAIVTARSDAACLRAIKTLEDWGVRPDLAAFMGRLPKNRVLDQFRPHIFFDDDQRHCDGARAGTPTAQVPSGQLALYAEAPVASGTSTAMFRARFMQVSRTYLTSKEALAIHEFDEWFSANVGAWPVDKSKMFVEELELSISQQPKGRDRRAAASKDTRAAKLKSFLSAMLLKYTSSE